MINIVVIASQHYDVYDPCVKPVVKPEIELSSAFFGLGLDCLFCFQQSPNNSEHRNLKDQTLLYCY